MWRQGQHLALIGPTGTGKTTLLEALASRRRYSVVFLTKSDTLAWRKFRTITKASHLTTTRPDPDGSLRLILRPPALTRANEFRAALKAIYKQGGWTVGFDELYELQILGLEPEIIQLYSEGRSEGVTCIGGMQRPSWVTRNGVSRWALSQPSYDFSFRVREERELKVMRDILGQAYSRVVAELPAYTFALREQASSNIRTGSVATLDEIF